MAPRIRSLKPDLWQDEALGRCHPEARLLFIGLITQADDEGRLRAAPALLKSTIFPYDDALTTRKVDGWMRELADNDLCKLYTRSGQHYAAIKGWHRHQRVDKPRQSSVPPPECETPANRDNGSENIREDSTNPPRHVAEQSPLEGKGEEGKGKDTPPTPPPARGGRRRSLTAKDLLDQAARGAA